MGQKICNICYKSKLITNFPRKTARKRRGHCKECRKLKKRGLIKKVPAKLDPNSDIQVRGRRNSKRFTNIVSYEKAQILVNNKMAEIIHPTLIHKLYELRDFRKAIFQRDEFKCYYCNQTADTIDHILPTSQGGITSFMNCVACCSNCNISKANLHIKNFIYIHEPFQITTKLKEDYALEKIEDINELMLVINKSISIYLSVLADAEHSELYEHIVFLNSRLKEIGNSISKHA